MLATREFDVVLYGATGFTGRQTVRYFAKFAPPELKWAIAGRNAAKLQALASGVPIIVADSADQPALDAMAARTRVLLTTAGPFALYGSGIVDACVRMRTHYCDITGETTWVRDMIDRHHDEAAAEGTRLIPFSGFDSIPSDLGAWLLADALGPQTATVKAFFQMAGGLNGGTLASALNMAETGASERMGDLFLLSPETLRAPMDLERDPTRAVFDADAQAWAAPFVMGAINTRVVRRTSQIRGTDFAYQEYTKVEGSSLKAASLVAGGRFFSAALRSSLFRGLLRAVAPAPGAGPSEKTMDEGWFRCELWGRAADGRTARALIADKGDPGNRVTVKCLCESALALALDEADLPQRAGFLTPASGLGHALVKRLRQRGMELSVS